MADATKATDPKQEYINGMRKQIDRLYAENARLRAALELAKERITELYDGAWLVYNALIDAALKEGSDAR